MIDIEETQRFVELGIIVFNEDGRKLYYKVRKLSVEESEKVTVAGQPKIEYELVSLSIDEKKLYGIEETSPICDETIDIEESDSELSTEEKLKKIREHVQAEKEGREKPNLTLSGDENAVKAAKQILEDVQSKRKGEPTKEELADQVEDLSSKLSIIAQQAFEKKCKELGCSDPSITTPDQLKAWEAGRKGYSSPAGSAPLNSQQYGISQNSDDIMKKKFNSIPEMITFLRSQKTKASEEIIQRLYQKYFQDWQRMGHPDTVYPPKDEPRTSGKPEVIMDKNTVGDEENSELRRWGLKKPPQNYAQTHNPDGSEK